MTDKNGSELKIGDYVHYLGIFSTSQTRFLGIIRAISEFCMSVDMEIIKGVSFESKGRAVYNYRRIETIEKLTDSELFLMNLEK